MGTKSIAELERESLLNPATLEEWVDPLYSSVRGSGWGRLDLSCVPPTGGSYSISRGDSVATYTSDGKLISERTLKPLNNHPKRRGPKRADPYEDVGEDTAGLDYTMRYMAEARDPDMLFEVWNEVIPAGFQFDTLIGTGISGCLAVPELARRLGVRWALCRKPNDSSHSPWPLEGHLGKRWVFVDDLISTGRTLARVWDVVTAIREDRGFPTEFAGAFLYNDHRLLTLTPGNGRINEALFKHSKRFNQPKAEVASL